MTETTVNTANSSDEIQPKSPLQYTWTYWYLKPEKNVDWERSLIRLIDVGFVEDFWATFNHLAQPSALSKNKINCDYHFFRKGIRPMWEDPSNSKGGRWLLNLGNDDVKLDNLWEATLLTMIGDCISQDTDAPPLSQFINGCVALIRTRGHKIALWTSEGQSEKIIRDIGSRWKSNLGIPASVKIQFELHSENSSGQKMLYEE